MLEKYNTTLEDLQAKGINHEDFSVEELEEKVKAEFEQQELGQEDISKQDSEEDPENNFALTTSQLLEEAGRVVSEFGTITDEYFGWEFPKFSLVDVDTENGH